MVRALSGSYRGSSGRDRLPQSRLWLVLRDFEGHDPRVYSTYAPVKALTKRGSDLGAAVLVGLPTRADLDVGQFGTPTYL